MIYDAVYKFSINLTLAVMVIIIW